MPAGSVVVIGASAGGIQPLRTILGALPSSIPAAVIVVVHRRAAGDGGLTAVFARATGLTVVTATDGAPLVNGHVYIAPADHHVLVEPDCLRVGKGPKESGFRPAIDPLFRSAARSAPGRTIGVLLSGALDDGVHGLAMIKDAGGFAFVQDPEDADFPSLPLEAIARVQVDRVLTAAQLGPAVARTCRLTARRARPSRSNRRDPQTPGVELGVDDMERQLGPPSGLTCPDCGGALWELREGSGLRYRCHVGHQYSSGALQEEQRGRVEAALWTAIRALEERAEFQRRLSKQATVAGLSGVSEGLDLQAAELARQAHQVREIVLAEEPRAPSAPPRKLKSSDQKKRAKRKSR